MLIWATEIISLCFMTMLSDVIRPDCLTSEPSEHSIALVRHFCRDFMVNNFVHIVKKLVQYWISVSKGNLKVVRTSEVSGYIATVHHENTKKTITLSSGNIEIETNPDVIRPQRGIIEHNDFVAAKILTDLKKILNKHKATMINFLKSVCRVSEMHPTMEGFNDTDGTEEVESRLDRLFKEKDNIFKKKSRE